MNKGYVLSVYKKVAISNASLLGNENVTINIMPKGIGVEIIGYDLSQGLTTEDVKIAKSLISKYLIVIFRNQNLSATQQLEISRYFGDIEVAWNKSIGLNRHKDSNFVHVITNDLSCRKPNNKSSTLFWHWDKSFIRYPTYMSHAFFPSEPQPDGFGMTKFANLYAAYEDLPNDLKLQVNPLYISHSYGYKYTLKQQNYEKISPDFQKWKDKFPDFIHPLVRIHPNTGKFVLNMDELSQSKIFGFNDIESKKLRDTLLKHATQERFLYIHTWKKGDFVLWDNLALIHQATPNDPSTPRTLHRTNVSSRELFEGKCIIIGIDSCTFDIRRISDKLFTAPLILDSDCYDNISKLEDDIKLLKSGRGIIKNNNTFPPNAILVIKGWKWKKSNIVRSSINILLTSLERCKLSFLQPMATISNIDILDIVGIAKQVQDACLKYFTIQNSHERLMSDGRTLDHLWKKEKILVPSYATHHDQYSSSNYTDSRMLIHASIFYEAFKNTHLRMNKSKWLKHLNYKSLKTAEKKLTNSTPYLIFLSGDQEKMKQTLLNRLQKSNEVFSNNCIIINTKIFFDHLFNDIDYAHKVKLWPYINEEKNHLILLMAKIALNNNINVIIDTYPLYFDNVSKLIDIAQANNGHSLMLAISTPLEICYQENNDQLYEQLQFRKLFSSNWMKFIDCFDATFLISNICDSDNFSDENIILMSEKEKSTIEILDTNSVNFFLMNAFIDTNKSDWPDPDQSNQILDSIFTDVDFIQCKSLSTPSLDISRKFIETLRK